MDDILFGNNNQATINRLAKRSYRANKQRNVFVTIALFLTAFMITSVFSLGCSYFETYQMQQIRAMGTTADVAITSLSEEQYEELSRSSLVSVVGVSQRLGSIDTSGMDDALLSITWIDETEWQEHRVPTISDIHGDYPQAKNEIMLPTWALRAMGIDDPQIGMNISLSYQLGTDYQYMRKTIHYIDMFAGIGGFREGLTRAGDFVCMGHCEIDKYADRSYRALFDTEGEWFIDDARKADPETMPDFELLCGGFPCQAYPE